MSGQSQRSYKALIAQGLLSGVCLFVTVFTPPANGAILIVSLSREETGAIARWAVAHDARLLGAGPVAHSLVVIGSRGDLFGPALRHGSLLVAGTVAGCVGGR